MNVEEYLKNILAFLLKIKMLRIPRTFQDHYNNFTISINIGYPHSSSSVIKYFFLNNNY